MALISCDFYSEALQVSTSMTVILPQETSTQIGMSGTLRPQGTPVLYLLHGLSDDHTTWQRRTSIERYAAELGLAVVMPAVHRSFYADEAHGHRYWTFLSEELPTLVCSFFQVSARPEDTYVAGLSMGGYGALKWAMLHPRRFAGAASLSGALDLRRLTASTERAEILHRVFGGDLGPHDDLLALLEDVDVDGLPPLHVSSGTEDEVMAGNEAFVSLARRRGVDLTVDFRDGGHDWAFWDEEIRTVLAWLPGLAGHSG